MALLRRQLARGVLPPRVRHGLSGLASRKLGVTRADWAVLEFWAAVGYEAGELPLAALTKWALSHPAARALRLSRSQRAPHDWNRAASWTCRVPTPEEFFGILVGISARTNLIEVALYPVCLFAICLPLSAPLHLFGDDRTSRVDTASALRALIIPQFVRELTTRGGAVVEYIIHDDDLCPDLGGLPLQHKAKRLADEGVDVAGDEGEELVPQRSFEPMTCPAHCSSAEEISQPPELETVHRGRQGGTSRDPLCRVRFEPEVQLLLPRSSQASSKIHNKPGKVKTPVRSVDGGARESVYHVRRSFANFVRAAESLKPLNGLA